MQNQVLSFPDIAAEAKKNPYRNDLIGMLMNHQGEKTFDTLLTQAPDDKVPLYTINLTDQNITSVLDHIIKLMPYQKGIKLKLTAPQKRRKLVSAINEAILNYIQKPEIGSIVNIIHELTANSEKANLESMVAQKYKIQDQKEIYEKLKNDREALLQDCDSHEKWVKISWKYSNWILKIEVKNNGTIDQKGLSLISDKVTTRLNTLADGYSEEQIENKLGAGLGLFFVNFFRDEMKKKYNFETLFRVYQNDSQETVASLIVMFENTR